MIDGSRTIWGLSERLRRYAESGLFECAFVGGICLIGGANHHNALELLITQLASIPVITFYLLHMSADRLREQAIPLALLAVMFIVPCIQLIPLPPAIWSGLPGRGAVADVLLATLGRLPWAPLSLRPDETERVVFFLLPPAAVLMMTLGSSEEVCRRISFVIPTLALFSLALGSLQVSAPNHDFLYPYAGSLTNIGSAVGIFANKNHQAALLLSAVPFTAVAGLSFGRSRRLPATVAATGAITLLLIGLAVVRSRAGVVLAGPVALGTAALILASGGWRLSGKATLIGLAPLFIAAILLLGLSPSGLFSRFEDPLSQDNRFLVAPAEYKAGLQYDPLGSGLGTFPEVFERVEPVGLVDRTYLNHAHNDYIELWIETGWVGPGILLGFLIWFVSRSVAVWRGSGGSSRQLARAGSVSVAVLLIHSALDYPLRTPALAVLFALGCALMARRTATSDGTKIRVRSSARHRAREIAKPLA